MVSSQNPTYATIPRQRPATWLRVVVNLVGSQAFVGTDLAAGQLIDATWGLLAGSVVAILASWALERRPAHLPLMLGCFAALSAGLTLLFRSTGFIKLEVSIHSLAVGLGAVASCVEMAW